MLLRQSTQKYTKKELLVVHNILQYLLVVFSEDRMTGTTVYRGGYVAGAAGRRQGLCDAPRWRTTQQPLWRAWSGPDTRASKIS